MSGLWTIRHIHCLLITAGRSFAFVLISTDELLVQMHFLWMMVGLIQRTLPCGSTSTESTKRGLEGFPLTLSSNTFLGCARWLFCARLPTLETLSKVGTLIGRVLDCCGDQVALPPPSCHIRARLRWRGLDRQYCSTHEDHMSGTVVDSSRTDLRRGQRSVWLPQSRHGFFGEVIFKLMEPRCLQKGRSVDEHGHQVCNVVFPVQFGQGEAFRCDSLLQAETACFQVAYRPTFRPIAIPVAAAEPVPTSREREP